MDEIQGTTAPDIYHDHNAKISYGVNLDTKNKRAGTGSYKFEGGVVAIAHASALSFTDSFGVSLSIRPDLLSIGASLVSKPGSYGVETLFINGNRHVRYWLETESGIKDIISDKFVTDGHWTDITASFRSGVMSLQVGSSLVKKAVTSKVIENKRDIIVGSNFNGNIDGVKIFDFKRLQLSAFSNGSSQIELIANEHGEITTQIRSLGNLRTASPLHAFVRARVYWKNKKELVDVNAEGSLLSYMTYAVAEGTANAMAELFWDEGDDSFASTVTDFSASVLVVGDVRDILKYGGQWWFGLADPDKKVVASVAAIGVLTTFTPILDVAMAGLKQVLKKALNTKSAEVLSSLAMKIRGELVNLGSLGSKTLTQFSDWFQWCAFSKQCDALLSSGIRHDAEVESSALLLKSYGSSNYDDLLGKLYSRFDSLGKELAEKAARDVSEALTLAITKTGKPLTGNAIEGMIKASLAMNKGNRKGTLINLVERFGASHKELDEILKLVNKYGDEAKFNSGGSVSRLGSALVTKNEAVAVANNNAARAFRFTMRYLTRKEASGIVFEAPSIAMVLGQKFRTRHHDVASDSYLYEMKSWISGKNTWKKNSDLDQRLAANKPVSGEYVEWMSDIFIKFPNLSELRWVIDARAAGKAVDLKKKMLAAFDDPRMIRFLMDEHFLTRKQIRILKDEFSSKTFDDIVEYWDDIPVELP
nr:LamG domain-containing protein [Shewanella nanhaiensis]